MSDSYLTQILDHIGFAPRPQQVTLFEALLETDREGTVAQAGTGTGKSLAVFAAAAHWRRKTGKPSLVVVPTNILMQQYISVDGPRTEEALGITIRSLMGRNRYLCSAAPGFEGVARAEEWVIAAEPEFNEKLRSDELVVLNPRDAQWFGCPGTDEGCDPGDPGLICHYRQAKARLEGADIIVTNAHLLVLDDQLRALPPKTITRDGVEMEWQPSIFPQFGALFVDEAHTLEDVLRGFATRSIPLSAVDTLGLRIENYFRAANAEFREAVAVVPTKELVDQLRELAEYEPPNPAKEPLKKHHKQAIEAAAYILMRGEAGAYQDREAVLWFQPEPMVGRRKPNPKLISTQINLAGGARRILTKVPFALVSGTIPKSLRPALGIPEARFIDCGHPFDYAKQGRLQISKHSGSFKASKLPMNFEQRAAEVEAAIDRTGGGTLCLFSSYKDMEAVHDALRMSLAKKEIDIRIQTREGDKQELGRWFKEHGNAVLFGTESFATGFDVPGDALRQVVIWKLPYPGLDPVTKAISARSRQRYEDMMRMKIVQAVGRLIRTTEDTGTIVIVDSRAENLVGDDDPMLAHLGDFTRVGEKKRTRAWDVE